MGALSRSRHTSLSSLASFESDNVSRPLGKDLRSRSSSCSSTSSLDLSPTNLFSGSPQLLSLTSPLSSVSTRTESDDLFLAHDKEVTSVKVQVPEGEVELEELGIEIASKYKGTEREKSLGDLVFDQVAFAQGLAKTVDKSDLAKISLVSRPLLEASRDRLYTTLKLTTLTSPLLGLLADNEALSSRVVMLELQLGSYSATRLANGFDAREAISFMRHDLCLKTSTAGSGSFITCHGVVAQQLRAAVAIFPRLKTLVLRAAAAISVDAIFPLQLQRLMVVAEENASVAFYDKSSLPLHKVSTAIETLVLRNTDISLGSISHGDGMPAWPREPKRGDKHGIRELDLRDVRLAELRRELDVRRLLGGPPRDYDRPSFSWLTALRLVRCGKVDYRSLYRAVEDAAATLEVVHLVEVEVDWTPTFPSHLTLGRPTTDLSEALGRCKRLRELDFTVHRDSQFLVSMISPGALTGVGRNPAFVDLSIRLQAGAQAIAWHHFCKTIGVQCLKKLTIYGVKERERGNFGIWVDAQRNLHERKIPFHLQA